MVSVEILYKTLLVAMAEGGSSVGYFHAYSSSSTISSSGCSTRTRSTSALLQIRRCRKG